LPAVSGSNRQNVTQTRRHDSWRARGICSPYVLKISDYECGSDERGQQSNEGD